MKKSDLFWILIFAAGVFGCGPGHYVTLARDSTSLCFFLDSPGARNVEFASSLDDYRGHAAFKNPSGLWEITLPAGAGFRYFYLVDGTFFLPDCRLKEIDDFGSQNCIYQPNGL